MNAEQRGDTLTAILCISLFIFWIVTNPVSARAQDPEAGRVLEKVVCRANSGQTYALYLPSYYTPDRQWPIIYALDAGARGILPVTRFKAGAEKYGYIVAGSNNSRNGPVGIVEEALGALAADLKLRFAIDNRQVYIAGFSGGSRVAFAAAVSINLKAAGVIACGAGLPQSMNPSTLRNVFSYGIAGIEDFNFPELRKLDDSLERLGFTHRFDIFKGGHDWPPESVCTRAIEWLEIQSMKAGLKPRESGRIDEIYSKQVSDARECEARQDFEEAWRLYSALAKDFAGLKEVRVFESKAAELRRSTGVIEAAKMEKKVGETQERLVEQIDGLFPSTSDGTEQLLQHQALIRILVRLRSDSNGKNEVERVAARRVLTQYWIRLNESFSVDSENRKYTRAASKLELMSQIRPENPQVFYEMARTYIVAGDRKKALKALSEAAARGFKDISALEENQEFSVLRSDPAYQKMIEAVKRNKP